MVGATRAFAIGPHLARVTGAYPRPQDVLAAAAVGRREKAILARLWMSEGIPFAFKSFPGLYEEARDWLAKGLELDAKEISMGGSGRLGYSLAPKRWGGPYRPASSDLDLFAVSRRLFDRLREDFGRWHEDYSRGHAQPGTDRERCYWDANRKETPDRIRRGFIDSIRVPNRQRYGVFLTMNSCLEELKEKLHKTAIGPKPRKRLTLRCYRDWDSYELQMIVNLKAAVDESIRSVYRDPRRQE